MPTKTPMLVAVGPWKDQPVPGQAPLAARLRAALPEARHRSSRDVGFVELDDAVGLLAALECAARGRVYAFGVVLGHTGNPELTALRVLEHARALPWGVAARAFPSRPEQRQAAAATEALLAAHVSLLRSRRPAAWAAIDAFRAHGSATAAAKELGIAHQTVTHQLRRSNLAATDRASDALTPLIGSLPAP